MKIIVTGAAGFVGANIVAALNAHGLRDLLLVDVAAEQELAQRLQGLHYARYMRADEFYPAFSAGSLDKFEAVFHQGACSDTMVQDRDYMLATNYECSKTLFEACANHGTRLIYASSAAVYGNSTVFKEEPACEAPLNIYGQSKLMFDNWLRGKLGTAAHSRFAQPPVQVAGLRYFNVYGPRESHKGRMASVAYHQFRQMRESGRVSLFGAYGGYAAGQQVRDFVSVQDVVAVNLWLLEQPRVSGIFNVGTGRAQAFMDVSSAVVAHFRPQEKPAQFIDFIDMPEALHGKYQCYTQADLSALRAAGYTASFADVQTGVSQYMRWLAGQPSAA
jgi:ADP-L-glycero-D-manno-heptose 6-epimerase